MAANNRIFYATQALNLRGQNTDGTALGIWYSPKGVQSVGMTTNFNIDQVFQLGQIELYDQVEAVPEIEVTLNKVIDGTIPLYLLCMCGNTAPSTASGKEMVNLANNRVNVRLGIFNDTLTGATGVPTFYVDASGMYLSRFTYTIPVDGNATEDITLVGNNKYWGTGSLGTPGAGSSHFGFSAATGATSISTIRRYSFNYAGSVLPTGFGGIRVPADRSNARPYVQSVSVSSDLGREAIYEIGRMAPYYRYVRFPVEVTSEFQVMASDGDFIDASDFSDVTGCGASYKNVSDKQITIQVCGSGASDTLTLDLGNKNKLTSVNYTGGDTGGGNASLTYSFRTFNKFVMTGAGSFVNTTLLGVVVTG
jgi:hypothetical protein